MKLSINHSEEDRDAAREIAAVCRKLEIPFVLQERKDWLRHGMSLIDEEATHAVFVISRATLETWWLPFQIGRAVERGLEILIYPEDKRMELPPYLEGMALVRGIEAAKEILTK